MDDEELFDLTYNEITGEFEYPHETREEYEERMSAIFEAPPVSLEEVFGNITEKMVSSYNTKKAKAMRIIQECEDNSIYLTREQKIQLFQNVINE